MRVALYIAGAVFSLSLLLACSQSEEQGDDAGLSLQILESFMFSCEAETGHGNSLWCSCVFFEMGDILGADILDSLMLESSEEEGSEEADAILDDAFKTAVVACRDSWDEDTIPTEGA